MNMIKNQISRFLKKIKLNQKFIGQLRTIYHLIIISKSPFYDAIYYKKQNNDLRDLSKFQLLRHFYQTGYKENRSPSERFNTQRYYQLRPDIKNHGINPLVHYELFGKHEGVDLKASLDKYFISNEWEDNFCKSHKKVTAKKKKIQLFAYYLPQYHNDTWNNKFWGQGFTEWSNVATARPLFNSHKQPKIPLHGFYNLHDLDAINNQCKIAKESGIDGFMLMVYEFENGVQPLRSILGNVISCIRENGLKYVFEWANEPWTRRWDGLDEDILLDQNKDLSENLCESLARSLGPYMTDNLYLKYDGKPALLVYRPQYFNNNKNIGHILKEKFLQEAGLNVTLGAMKTFREGDESSLHRTNEATDNFDFDVSYPPHRLDDALSLISDTESKVYNYAETVDNIIDNFNLNIPRPFIPCVFPSWDNTPRRGMKSNIFQNCNSDSFKKWLSAAYDFSTDSDQSLNTIFINSWNEWAEGAQLEPSTAYGFAKLNAVSEIHDNFNLISNKPNSTTLHNTENRIVAVYHCYNQIDLEYVVSISRKYPNIDFWCTLCTARLGSAFAKIKYFSKNIFFLPVSNRGRDFRFVSEILPMLSVRKYDVLVKIHFKTRDHLANCKINHDTAYQLIDFHLRSAAKIRDCGISRIFAKKSLILKQEEHMGSNHENIKWLCDLHNLNYSNFEQSLFCSGGFFIVNNLSALFEMEHDEIGKRFEWDSGTKLDGLLCHALERFIPFYLQEHGAILEPLDEVKQLTIRRLA